MEQQQIFLTIGITKLCETHTTLENLNFSECILQEITGMIDDLMGLIEDETIKNQLLSNFIDYNKEKDAYTIKKRRLDEDEVKDILKKCKEVRLLYEKI